MIEFPVVQIKLGAAVSESDYVKTVSIFWWVEATHEYFYCGSVIVLL